MHTFKENEEAEVIMSVRIIKIEGGMAYVETGRPMAGMTLFVPVSTLMPMEPADTDPGRDMVGDPPVASEDGSC